MPFTRSDGRMSSISVAAIIALCAEGAPLSWVAMNRVPITAMSAPRASAPAIPAASPIPPPTRSSPSNARRIRGTKAKGDRLPVCPPAPAQVSMRPSTPASIAFSAWRRLTVSWMTTPPHP